MGGVGGAVNAWLCYAKFYPRTDLSFSWPVIPAGACHGALLAILALGSGAFLSRRSLLLTLVRLPVIGWIAGWLSWIPLQAYVYHDSIGSEWGFGHGKGLTLRNAIETIFWPFRWERDMFFMPYLYFGFVVVVWVGLLQFSDRWLHARSWCFAAGILSGVLGSLWWWISWKPWWFSLLHGTIWGLLVGFGVWKSQPWRAVEV